MNKNPSIPLSFTWNRQLLFPLLTIAGLILGYTYFNYENRYFNFSVFLGLIFAPYIFRQTSLEKSHRLLWIVLGMGLLLCFRRSSSLFYYFSGISILYVIESHWGKLNYLPIFLLAMISSLAGYAAYVWSFPIRLQLSDWAARALSIVGWEATASGNIINLNGSEFSVDPACMGLSMLLTAGILGLLIMAHFERTRQYTFSFFSIGSYLLLILLLAIGANFTRLLALVVFQILPASPAHDAVGLLSLLVYVLVPFYVYMAYGINWEKRTKPKTKNSSAPPSAFRWASLSYILILLLVLLNGPKFKIPVQVEDLVLHELSIDGFEKTFVDGGILKLENKNTLVYLKPPAKAFQGTHDPRICWQGTGYDFTHIRKDKIGGEEVYTARLEKDGESLYTAWWFDNGQERTIDEWRWRWSTLAAGIPFRLINLTTLREEDLEREVLAFWDEEW